MQVTADGELWQKQRNLMGPALRIDVLDDIIVIAKNAVDRLCSKLEPLRGSGEHVDMNEELRLLKLQTIGEAVLSLAPEECDKVRVGMRRGSAIHGGHQVHTKYSIKTDVMFGYFS
jgi:cytochrome P450